MFTDPEGLIEFFDWGEFRIAGEVHSAEGKGVGKDICILGGQVFPWDERKGHRLTPKMVRPILHAGVKVLVIGNGVNGAIQVTHKTRQVVSKAGIERLIIEKTPDACRIYNQLYRQGTEVALLAHGTC